MTSWNKQTGRRQSIGIGAAFLLLGILLVGPVSIAHAHVELQQSNPTPGEQVSESPQQLTLTFSGPILSANARLLTGTQELPLPLQVAAENPTQASGEITETLTAGIYQVIWEATSEDGHLLTGSYSFEVLPSESDLPILWVGVVWLGLALLVAVVLYRRRSYAKRPA